MRVLYPDGLPMQGFGAGAAEGDTPDGRMPHQAGGRVYASIGCQLPGERAHRPKGLIGHMCWYDGNGDVRLQYGIEERKEALERPLTFGVQGIDKLCPAQVLTHRSLLSRSLSTIDASGFAHQIVRRSYLALGIVVAESDDRGGLVVLRPGRKEESLAA